MNNYKNLRKTVTEIAREITMYSPGKVEQVLTEAFHEVGGPVLDAWQRLTMDICHDRAYCELLGVDYNNLPKGNIRSKEDTLKIYAFTMVLAKEDPSMILPLTE